MAPDTKVWIYPSSRKFYKNELEGLETKTKAFVLQWAADHALVDASYALKYDRFIVFFAGAKNKISTKALDQMAAFVLQLQNHYQVTLLDKMNVCFKQGPYVQYKALKEFKKLVRDKAVNKNTLVFNNLVSNKYEFDAFWEIPAGESWYGNLFG